MNTLRKQIGVGLLSVISLLGCATSTASAVAKDPKAVEVVAIDRFSDAAGHLFVRSKNSALPGPNEPIDMDTGPFITQGLTPDGRATRYYNLDVQSTKAAPIYVLFREGEERPVAGQLNIVDVIPGDRGYSDFWQVHKVTVPKNYVVNSVSSLAELKSAGYAITRTDKLVNCPVVPNHSTARLRAGAEPKELQSGWYKGKVVKYFTFEEADLRAAAGDDTVPVAPIYVTFNVNPDQPNGGPTSGFRLESDGQQTHNVLQAGPRDPGYSPLWLVNVYDNKDWGRVRDLETVLQAKLLAPAVAIVNCPVVYVDDKVAKLEMR